MSQQKSLLPPLGEVKYIQSFLPTSDHVRRGSVLEVNTTEDLQSPKLGVSAWDKACKTCDNFLEDCSGHHGHMELLIPTYRIFFVKRILTILNNICFYCQRLRMPMSDPNYRWISKLDLVHRLNYINKYSSCYKRCSTSSKGKTKKCSTSFNSNKHIPSDQITGCCGKLFINFYNEDRDSTFIKAVVPLDGVDHDEWTKDPSGWKPFEISPSDVYACLSNLSKETKEVLGCNEWNDPSALMWECIPVPSHNTRPCHMFSGVGGSKKKSHNDWTKLLKNILSARNDLRDVLKTSSETINICYYSLNDIVSRDFRNCFRYGYLSKKKREVIKKRLKDELKRTVFGATEGAWRQVTKQIAAFHSYRHKKFSNKGSSTYGKPPMNVEERYKYQKLGRFRGNVIAKRVNFAMRGVLEGSIDLRPDQVGIPKQEAMGLSRKIYVNRMNMKMVHNWVMNGAYTYPGANYLTMKDGTEINLSYYENRRDIDLNKVLFVRRHLLDGDMAMVNRQPTLHRPSMMSFYIKVINGYAIRLNYSVFTPMAADCDGDEVNVHIPQTLEAIAELEVISCVKNCIMKDGKIWIKFIQNAVIGAYLMSDKSVRLDIDDVHDITSFMDIWGYPPPSQESPKEWTGHQIISMMLPDDFSMTIKYGKEENKDDVIIVNGHFLSGRLDDSVLNGSRGILNHMYRDYADKDVTMRFLHDGYRMFQRYIDIYGLSAGYFDCALDFHDIDSSKKKKKECPSLTPIDKIMHRIDDIRGNITKLNQYSDRFPTHNPKYGAIDVETNIKLHVEKINKMMCTAVNDYHHVVDNDKSNGVMHAIYSGAKGSPNVINQMCGIVSQIYVMYKRCENVSSHFRFGKNTMESFGFVSGNYSTGVNMTGVISEAHATCESVVNKNKGTSKSGYTVRKLTTCMMGVVVNHAGSAVDTRGRIIWDIYGNDGYDPMTMTNCKLRLLIMKEWDIPKRYGILYDLKQVIMFSSSKSKTEWNKVIAGEDSLVDEEWFKNLKHSTAATSSTESSTYTESSTDLTRFMTDKVTEVWYTIRRRKDVVYTLVQETNNLILLRNRLKELMVRSHESFDTSIIRSPFSFEHLFNRCKCKFYIDDTSRVDMTPVDYPLFLNKFWNRLIKNKLVVETNLTLKSLFFDWMSTRSLMIRWRFGILQLNWVCKEIVNLLIRCRVQAGESVGINATQCLGEPFTQMTLKTPHLSGKFPTICEGTVRIANIVDGNFSNPTMTIVLKKNIKTEQEVRIFGLSLVRSYLIDVCTDYPTYTIYEYDKDIKKCLIRININRDNAIQRMISTRKVVNKLCKNTGLSIDCFKASFSTDMEWYIYIDIPMDSMLWKSVDSVINKKRSSDELVADNIIYNLYRSVVINGLSEISNFIYETIDINTISGKSKRWSITTLGSSLAKVLTMAGVDSMRTVSNDCTEMCTVLGIHAARKSLENEYMAVMSGMADDRHIKLVARMMASDLIIKGMKIKQCGQNIPPLQRAAYEQGPKQMLDYCARAERDYSQTICGAALTNNMMNVGTGYNLDLIPAKDCKQPVGAKHIFEGIPTHICDYVASSKVDGLRLFLTFFHDRNGAYICNLYDRNGTVFSIPSTNIHPSSAFSGTILDGDLVRIPGTDSFCFVVFDCLMSCGNKSSVLRYDQRIEIGREIVYRMATYDLSTPFLSSKGCTKIDMGADSPYALPISCRKSVSTHMFIPGALPFHITVKPLIDMCKVVEFSQDYMHILSFPIDGFIFTKLSDPAYPFRVKKDSVIKCKQKSKDGMFNDNTIDVIVNKTSDNVDIINGLEIELYELPDLSLSAGSDHVNIRGINNFRAKTGSLMMFAIDVNHRPILFSHTNFIQEDVTINEGMTYECRWSYIEKRWQVFRFRDKAPNTISTVVSCVTNILEDLSINDLR